jgi:hypothetical protein
MSTPAPAAPPSPPAPPAPSETVIPGQNGGSSYVLIRPGGGVPWSADRCNPDGTVKPGY